MEQEKQALWMALVKKTQPGTMKYDTVEKMIVAGKHGQQANWYKGGVDISYTGLDDAGKEIQFSGMDLDLVIAEGLLKAFNSTNMGLQLLYRSYDTNLDSQKKQTFHKRLEKDIKCLLVTGIRLDFPTGGGDTMGFSGAKAQTTLREFDVQLSLKNEFQSYTYHANTTEELGVAETAVTGDYDTWKG